MKIWCSAKSKRYPIIITENWLAEFTQITEASKSSSIVFITHDFLHNTYLTNVTELNCPFHFIIVPEGEKSKSLQQVELICSKLASFGCDRNCLIVTVGGGMIGDLAGFCASIYMRGVKYIHIPTTLLAQVDSSVGGKTAVNVGSIKNLVGTIYQPEAVIIHTRFLNTLPNRQMINGYAECLKYGFISSSRLSKFFKRNPEELNSNPKLLVQIISKCVKAKVAFVNKDETDTGIRAALNFGHTIGHAIEAVDKHTNYLHGEAISIGMVGACFLGERLKITPTLCTQRVIDSLTEAGLPTKLSNNISIDSLMKKMKSDKKNRDAHYSLILLEDIGQLKHTKLNNDEDICQVLRNLGAV